MGIDVESRLVLLETRQTLLDLIARYAHGFDGHDEALLRSIWFDDSVLDLGKDFGRFEGIEAILDGARAFWREIPHMHHWMANQLLQVEPAQDSASAVSALDCLITNKSRGQAALGGVYRDRFERRDGRWAIAERSFELHYQTPIKDWVPELGTEAGG